MNMRKRQWSSALAMAAVIAMAACGGDGADAPPADTGATPAPAPTPTIGANVQLPEGVTQEMVTQGKTIFETSTCWTCHGMDAAGGPLAPSLLDTDWLNSDGSFQGIMEVVRVGVPQPREHPGAMPPMGGAQLSEEQIRQVSAYVYAISHGS